MKRHVLIVIFLLSAFVFAQNTVQFEKGNSLYSQGQYEEAIEAYKSILETNFHSAELYYNLGNAYYKLNKVAPSIFYYEKALQLAPNDADIKNNLAFARNMTIDAIYPIPESAVAKFLNSITNFMSFDAWAKTAVILVCCFVILFLIYYFAYSTLRKRVAFIGSMVLLMLVVLTLALAFHKYNLDNNDNPAIVFIQESKVRTEPNSRSEESFTLHEGTKVQILDTVKNWKRIKLADGKTGWISEEDIRSL